MKPYQIADRLSLLYGEKYPLVKELERVVNTEELSSIFTLAQFALTRKHSETVRALMNLVYERTDDDNVFVLFKVIKPIMEDQEALNALKNVCAAGEFVNLQTELLFRVIMSFPEPTEEILDALKNLIAVDSEPDLFLLFKVLQAIDPECEEIATLKSNTLMKTKMAETVDFITGKRYVIPQNMKKMINRFEGDALTDAFSRGQLRSKMWLVDIVKALEIDLGDTIYVCAGWYGVLSALLFERIETKNIYSFDIDPSTDNPADTLNKEYIMDNMKFKSFVYDVRNLKYTTETLPINHYRYTDAINFEKTTTTHEISAPTCVINTSCEHIENFDEWFGNIPKGTLVIMQNNNFVEHDDLTVVNTIDCEHAWVEKLNLSEVIYQGTLELEKYDRYMVIGRK